MLSEDAITERLAALPGWNRAEVGGKPGISKSFDRKNFLDGLALVSRVADLAEKANHHPDVLLTYPRVCFSLTTHDAGGLTERDFDLAAEIQKVIEP